MKTLVESGRSCAFLLSPRLIYALSTTAHGIDLPTDLVKGNCIRFVYMSRILPKVPMQLIEASRLDQHMDEVLLPIR